jgi:hypothetical protein
MTHTQPMTYIDLWVSNDIWEKQKIRKPYFGFSNIENKKYRYTMKGAAHMIFSLLSSVAPPPTP